jgi:hypothetical protein
MKFLFIIFRAGYTFKEMGNCSKCLSTGMKLNVMVVKWLAPIVVFQSSGCPKIFSGFLWSLQHMTTCTPFHFMIILLFHDI